MHRTRIKICGITRPEDALAAADAGADAIGMILHANAPRRISRDVARRIVLNTPDEIDVVGVFVDADPQAIRDIANELELDQIQLHGHESPEILSSLEGLTLVKAIRGAQFHDWARIRGVLIEPGGGRYAGGNGTETDWDALAAVLASAPIKRESLVIAGGLRADNVADVVRRFQPWTVDVSSGVEASLGVKSLEKMQSFCAAVRAIDQTL